MPGRNGVEFLRKVHETYPNTVRIVFSGYADTSVVVEAINVGQIYRFIPKPWNDDELRVTIANAFERYKLYTDNIMLTENLKKANEGLTTINNDLEKIVDARTNELRFQYAVLERSQVILNALPVGILGIDSGGTIVYINDMAEKLLPKRQKVGCASSTALPDQLNRYLEQGSLDLNKAQILDLDDRKIMVRVAPVKHKDLFAGRVIVIHDGE
jgi:two-component system NtrC family sensor kinase